MNIIKQSRSPGGWSRLYTLLLLALLSLVSVGGYWFLGAKIADGERQVVEGKRQLAMGNPKIVEGKADLAAGKQRLSEGKEDYRDARGNFLLVWADKLLQGGSGFEDAREQIAAGERKIDEGEERVRIGESRADTGREKLRLGGERLHLARIARGVCAVSSLLFAIAAIVLGLRWR